jgi:hypothetical protein
MTDDTSDGGIIVETPKQRLVKYSNEGADIPTFYANNAEVMVSTWDMRIRLGQIESVEADVITVKNVAVLFMSIEHARAFIERAVDSLNQWERLNIAGQKKG